VKCERKEGTDVGGVTRITPIDRQKESFSYFSVIRVTSAKSASGFAVGLLVTSPDHPILFWSSC
jgi:hypothetical protein